MIDRPSRNVFHDGGTQRHEALADGVFAIVMTLVVFEIALPRDRSIADLGRALLDLWPSFLAYAISVGLVGIYWTAHRNQFQVIQRADTTLNWLNLLCLALVSLVPFSTRLLAAYHANPLALCVYGINLAMIGLSQMALWRYATTGHRLVAATLPRLAIRYGYSRSLVGVIGYAWASVLGFLSPTAALVVFATLPILYILPGVQRAWYDWFGLHDPDQPRHEREPGSQPQLQPRPVPGDRPTDG